MRFASTRSTYSESPQCWRLVLWCGLLLAACGGAAHEAEPAAVSPDRDVDAGGDGGTWQGVANPSGSCVAPDDGSRKGYHYPGEDAQWLIDCQNPLQRELYRVFVRAPGIAATIPRLDHHPDLQPACEDAADPLHPLVQKYGICSSVDSEAAVERINAMQPADALELTRFVHGKLKFEVTSEPGEGVRPMALPSDVLDACDLRPTDDHPEFAAICERERDRVEAGFDIGYFYRGPGAVELVARLNDLYGIED